MTVSQVFSALAISSLLLTSICVPLVRLLARRVGFVDHPAAGVYKTHTEPTPYGGGLAIWLGVVVPLSAMLCWLAVSRQRMFHDGVEWISPWAPYLFFPLEPWSPTVVQVSQIVAAVAAASMLLLLGLADDRRALPAGLRFGVQLVLACLLTTVVPGFRLALFEGPEVIGIVGSVVWLVAMTNSFNFLDNMNGLSASLAAIIIGTCGAIALITQHVPAAILCLVVLGSCTGFLMYNFPRASIFMGDAGGLFLGFLGGALSILLYDRLATIAVAPDTLPYRFLPLAVFGVPLYDLVTVVGLRLHRGLAPWAGDTNHVSHRLVAAGLSRTQAVLVLCALAALVAFPCAGAMSSGPVGAWWSLGGATAAIALFGVVDLWLARRRAAR